MTGSELSLLQRQRFLLELEGVGLPTELGIAIGQVGHAPKRVRVIGTDDDPAPSECLLVKLDRLRIPPQAGKGARQVVRRTESLRIVRAKLGLAQGQRLLQDVERVGITAQR